jgi:bidirectional [NiFe] hydrogenase diaphorase subunit
MNVPATRITLTIDGRKVRALPGEMLLDVARREGFDIPSACAFEGIRPYGACRLCLVKVRQGTRERVVTACNYPITASVDVVTGDEKILRLRRTTASLLAAMAPASQEMRDLARRLGAADLGLRSKDPDNRCIACGLCVRVCEDVVGAHAITFSARGQHRKISLPFEELDLETCTGCGACSFVCPTGCIDMERQKLRLLRGTWRTGERPCRYALMGLLPGAACDHDYDCVTCSLDRRMFEMAQGMHPAFLLPGGSDR